MAPITVKDGQGRVFTGPQRIVDALVAYIKRLSDSGFTLEELPKAFGEPPLLIEVSGVLTLQIDWSKPLRSSEFQYYKVTEWDSNN